MMVQAEQSPCYIGMKLSLRRAKCIIVELCDTVETSDSYFQTSFYSISAWIIFCAMKVVPLGDRN